MHQQKTGGMVYLLDRVGRPRSRAGARTTPARPNLRTVCSPHCHPGPTRSSPAAAHKMVIMMVISHLVPTTAASTDILANSAATPPRCRCGARSQKCCHCSVLFGVCGGVRGRGAAVARAKGLAYQHRAACGVILIRALSKPLVRRANRSDPRAPCWCSVRQLSQARTRCCRSRASASAAFARLQRTKSFTYCGCIESRRLILLRRHAHKCGPSPNACGWTHPGCTWPQATRICWMFASGDTPALHPPRPDTRQRPAWLVDVILSWGAEPSTDILLRQFGHPVRAQALLNSRKERRIFHARWRPLAVPTMHHDDSR
ncbi:hypothetical protein BC628DRAFT_690087 [Trametes gibbosa]|nr:hypothetical protein BC628DRAFT_690087 [Trametes gibbosa]